MANLIYNGQIIPINDEGRVNVTQLYNAANRPTGREPGNFKSSKAGAAKIKEYGAKGTWVWQSRTGSKTIAIVDLAYVYLQYLGDPMAAEALKQVYETREDVTYNKLPRISSEQGFSQSSNMSSSFESQSSGQNWLAYIIAAFLIMGIISQQKSSQQASPTPPNSPHSFPYYR